MKFTNCILLAMIFIMTSCMRSDREHIPMSEKFLGIVPYDWMKPRAYRERPFDGMPKIDKNYAKIHDEDTPGKNSYAAGYQAGCQTMNSVAGEGLYRLKGPKINPDKITNDPWYLRGYQDGAQVCTFNLDWDTH